MRLKRTNYGNNHSSINYWETIFVGKSLSQCALIIQE